MIIDELETRDNTFATKAEKKLQILAIAERSASVTPM
jgi:septum formation topological specificity factor MinE